MSNESIKDELVFDVSSGNWFEYIERVEKYFNDNDIQPDVRLSTLISLMGEEAYELLDALASPDDPKTLKYEDAITRLNQYLQPSILESRYKFWQRKQAEKEDVITYAEALEKLARNCRFEKSHRMDHLRDQFVCGMRNDVIRQKLFEHYYATPPKFYEAVKFAKNLEKNQKHETIVSPSSMSLLQTKQTHSRNAFW